MAIEPGQRQRRRQRRRRQHEVDGELYRGTSRATSERDRTANSTTGETAACRASTVRRRRDPDRVRDGPRRGA
ncbi:hypothetical protein HNR49_002377 [Halobacterium salinarum]|uniref:Uncharacterized protein n=1 Tax=Halobacterium salinarum TaxID=2242 RepID=A0A841HDR5_HALSI|nr:hypothetical protein [Halobacterium salinarum]